MSEDAHKATSPGAVIPDTNLQEPSQAEESRSKDRSPERRHRSRSADGDRSKKPRRKDAGFKWKDKRRDEDETQERSHGLKRGYRDQYKPQPRRSRSRSRSPRSRDSERYANSERRDRERDRDPERRKDTDFDRPRKDRDNDDKGGERRRRDDRGHDRPEKREQPKTIPSAPQQEMILVTVNDRLGTKKQVPCLPTDTVKDFKAVVAMMIGRRPHEILLKRQSERPFKDFLTLQDYGVSNNVQLDLEVDTGD